MLTAPTDGTIANINGAVGQWISGGPTGSSSTSSASTTSSGTSSAFVTLTDLSAPLVSAQVSEADIGKVQPGQPATFTVAAYPGRTFTGQVATIEPAGQTISNVVTYNVLVAVDPTDVSLLPSMTATVTIITEDDQSVVLVPNAAISYAQTQSGGQAASSTGSGGANAAVYVLQNGTPTRVAIQTGSSNGQSTVVISGLQPGDQVVTGLASNGSKQSTTSSSSNIFGFGAPGGGNNSSSANRTGGQPSAPSGAGAPPAGAPAV